MIRAGDLTEQVLIQRRSTSLDAAGQQLVTREEAETQRAELDRVSRETMNEADNFTAMQLASMEIETGEKFGVSTGTGINPGTR